MLPVCFSNHPNVVVVQSLTHWTALFMGMPILDSSDLSLVARALSNVGINPRLWLKDNVLPKEPSIESLHWPLSQGGSNRIDNAYRNEPKTWALSLVMAQPSWPSSLLGTDTPEDLHVLGGIAPSTQELVSGKIRRNA